MPLAFHASRVAKFEQQQENAETYILPFIAQGAKIDGVSVLEIGCGEGGILRPFLDRGCNCVGVDLSKSKIDYAKKAFAADIAAGRADFIAADIYDDETGSALAGRFDIVIMKDTIEHVYGHTRILNRIKGFLSAGGVLFVGFPPWRMPYGGHQQMAESRLGKMPWYHLLPREVYRNLLKTFGESDLRVEELMEVVDTRLSINQFERMVRETGYRVLNSQHYLVNPIYKYKFGLTPRKQARAITKLPWVRDFMTTTCYYLLGVDATPRPTTPQVARSA